MKKPKTVDEFIELNSHYTDALNVLRELVHETDLEESVKWMFPVYGFGTKNVLSFCAFKNYVGIWFFQGVFLSDPLGVLSNAQEGKTKAMRQWRFNDLDEIEKHKSAIRAYFAEAIQNQHEGKEMLPVRSKKEVLVPKELEDYFKTHKDVHLGYEKFTPGKKREFCEYISSAKRAETKEKRLEKISQLILAGVSLNDKYRK